MHIEVREAGHINSLISKHGGKNSKGGGLGGGGIGSCSLGGGGISSWSLTAVDTSAKTKGVVLVAKVETGGGLRQSAV